MKTCPKPNRPRGFTLVEIVMSLGIISFGLVALLGLIPTGLDTLRESRTTTLYTEIAKTIANAAQQTDFTQITNTFDGKKFYFDNEGISVPQGRFDQIYEALVTTGTNITVPASPAPQQLPGLASIRIDIRRSLSGTNSTLNKESFTVYVADNGR